MSDSPFRVIIVGASIAGLTLAHCLQRANIDHIVLERRDEIAPEVGASIGILPNGSRILDQLGLYEKIEELIEPLDLAHIVYPDGFKFTSIYPKIISERFGFPIAFFERQKLLEILYETYPDHSKIHVNKKVVEVKLLDNKAGVITNDGSLYTGDLIVGADGVHSRIRSEIWRLADMKNPGLVTNREKTGMETEYVCVFGISSPINGLYIGEQVNALYDCLTIATVHGKGGRIFWFIIKKLEKKFTYPDRPRFSPETVEEIITDLKSFRIWKNICVKDLWDHKIVASMSPLEENLFRTWHYDRMLLIGDSVHKMTPNLAQGANSAIEDAAVLASLLEKALHSNFNGARTQQKFSGLDVDALLQHYRKLRYNRIEAIYRQSRFLARVHARDGFFRIILGRYYVPYAGDAPADAASKAIADAEIIRYLPQSLRSGPGWVKYRTKKTPIIWSWQIWCIIAFIVFWFTVFGFSWRPLASSPSRIQRSTFK